jgi:hypothetical protein
LSAIDTFQFMDQTLYISWTLNYFQYFPSRWQITKLDELQKLWYSLGMYTQASHSFLHVSYFENHNFWKYNFSLKLARSKVGWGPQCVNVSECEPNDCHSSNIWFVLQDFMFSWHMNSNCGLVHIGEADGLNVRWRTAILI